jgi:hypothetical protein
VENFLTDDILLHEDSFEKKKKHNIGKIRQNLLQKEILTSQWLMLQKAQRNT